MRRIFIISLFVTFTHIIAAQSNNDSIRNSHSNRVIDEDIQKILDVMSKIKISGYLQGQYQYGEKDASLNVGGDNTTDHSFNRIGIRRGRLKFAFQEKIFSTVFQIDITDKGVAIKDAYVNLGLPKNEKAFAQVGMFNIPFGFEIDYSSSKRESPERAMVMTKLFADYRDLGAMLSFSPKEGNAMDFLKLNLALTSGNGENIDIYDHKSLITQLQAEQLKFSIFEFDAGFSYYNGGMYQGTENVYKMKGDKFQLNNSESNKTKFAKREYFGFNAHLSINNPIGQTKIFSEYLWGTQPGSLSTSKSYAGRSVPDFDTYIRSFRGGYVTLVQKIGEYPVSLVGKYDWYNPNTAVSGNQVGLNGTGKGDVAYHNYGVGLIWDVVKNVRVQGYYQWIINDKTINLPDFDKNRKDNYLTIRLQVAY